MPLMLQTNLAYFNVANHLHPFAPVGNSFPGLLTDLHQDSLAVLSRTQSSSLHPYTSSDSVRTLILPSKSEIPDQIVPVIRVEPKD